MRDIVLRRVPAVLDGNTLYATWAPSGQWVLFVLPDHGQQTAGTLAALVVGTRLCLPGGG